MLESFKLEGWALCEGSFTGGVCDLCRFRDSSGGIFREQQRLQRDPVFQHGHPHHHRQRAHRRLPGHLWQSVGELRLQGTLGPLSVALRGGEASLGCCVRRQVLPGERKLHWVAMATRLVVHGIEFMLLLCLTPEALTVSAWS